MAASKPVAPSIKERVQQSYRQLAVVATQLNTVSDKLTSNVSDLEAALIRLHLGITSWFAFRSWHSEDHFHYWSEEVGFTKLGGKWCIAIREVSGDQQEGHTVDSEWSFKEAPRLMRIKAIAKIPDLLEQLIKDGTQATKTATKQIDEVAVLTEAINEIAGEALEEAQKNAKSS
jgi:hypothetical protein